MKICLCLVLLSLAGCATAPKLSRGAGDVVFMKPKSGKCKLVKEKLHIVAWFHKRSSKVLRNKLLNEASEIGGNAIELLELYHGSDQAIANVYKCPQEYISWYKKQLN